MKRRHDYSQHFLRSPRLIKELVGHTTIKKADTVWDIGAGSGIIASVLAERAGQVVAVEYEPRTTKTLRHNMAQYDNVEVREGDFLTMMLPHAPYKVFANIPFHLSSPIVRKLTEAEYAPQALWLVVQRQFARKIVPGDDHFTGQLGAMVGPLYAARIRKKLQRTDFWPHPTVDTVLLELIRRDEPLIAPADMPRYRRFIEDCFSTPVKFAKASPAKIGLPSDIRPSQLTLEQWVALFVAIR